MRKWKCIEGRRQYDNGHGYRVVCIGRHNHFVHRLIMEEHLGRKLRRGEVVHHRNHVKTDNRIENLEVMSNSEHISQHYPLRWSIADAMRLRDKGLGIVGAARRLGLHPRTLLNAFVRRGIPWPAPIKVSETLDLVAIAERRRAGEMWKTLAREFGVGHTTLPKACKRAGLL